MEEKLQYVIIYIYMCVYIFKNLCNKPFKI